MRKGDLVHLKWEDSLGCPRGWEPLDEARSTAYSVIESVGWVMACGAKSIQIAPHVSSTKKASVCVQGHMTILKSALLRVEVLLAAT